MRSQDTATPCGSLHIVYLNISIFMNRKSMLVLLAISSAIFLSTVIAFLYVPIMQFEKLFSAFGPSAPFSAELILSTYNFWWLLPLLYLLLAMTILASKDFPTSHNDLIFRVCVAGNILAPLLYIITQLAIYYGVFSMTADGSGT